MSTRDIHDQIKNKAAYIVLGVDLDGLTGLKEAILTAYPKAEIQRCIIHQLRNSFKYVSYKDLKEFSRDFKEVYKAINEEDSLKLIEVEEKWGEKYPFAIKSWEMNWDVILSFSSTPTILER